MFNYILKPSKESKKSAYILGGIIGFLTSVLFMIIFAMILLFFDIDRQYAKPFATISVAVGSYLASRISAKKIGDRGYITGLIIGGAVFLLITILSMIFGNGLTANTIFHFIIIMLSSLVGGISGVNYKKTKKFI